MDNSITTFNCNEVIRFLDALIDGVHVERPYRAQVDDLGADALLGQFLGRVHRELDRDGMSNDGDVGTCRVGELMFYSF